MFKNIKDFFPTPIPVIEQMGIDCYDKNVLEPSAGKGDLVDWLKNNGAKEVIACELNDDLRKIVSTKCNIINSDFLKIKKEQVSHIELIVMNPPFSKDEKHIIKAWEIAPEGCEIISLCNWQTHANSYSSERRELKSLISNYGEIINMGSVFIDSERQTSAEIGLIRLFKPVVSKEFDWDGFYYTNDAEVGSNGVMPYNEIRSIVNRYVAAVNCFDEVEQVAEKMKNLISGLGFQYGNVCFKAGSSSDDTIYHKSDFARQFQIQCWKHIFDRMNINKYVTKGVMEDINKFVAARSNYPFTMKNIYRMLDIIVGTRGETMKRAIVEAVDKFTKYTHENRFNVEGWKTNEGHMLNKKFISGWICEQRYSGNRVRIKDYNSNFEYLNDLTKAICYITGKNFDDIPRITHASIDKDSNGEFIKIYKYLEPDGTPTPHMTNYFDYKNEDAFETNTWYTWGFFKFKVFKKGSGHFQFIDEDVWGKLNKAYAEAKGQVLPEDIKHRKAA